MMRYICGVGQSSGSEDEMAILELAACLMAVLIFLAAMSVFGPEL
jgi:hypothetical protein